MTPSIEKIVFNVRGKKLELSSDEAKELKQILSDLFGETKVVHEHHNHEHHNQYIPPYRPWTYWSTGTFSGYDAALGQAYTADAKSISNHPQTLCLSLGN